jgi:tetratricopeptide (TPR) repeat protein
MTTGAALALLGIVLSAGTAAAETPLAESLRVVSAQGQRYGIVDAGHPSVVRVRGIFERVVRAAGRRPGVVLEVQILDTPKVILEALRGGTIVVSRGAVDLAGGDDAALAFLLGHEVAHQVNNHHGYLASLGVLGAGPTLERPMTNEAQRAYQAIELDADRLGVLYAVLAGYRAAAAIPVLMTLIERAGTDAFHPEPRARAAAIREQLTQVSAHVELFHAGVWLLNVGRPLEAARVLEHFASIFHSREVLSAIGVAYHREALRHAPSPAFRHVLVVDGVTRAVAPRGAPDPAYRAHLARAREYYTVAADVDPRYAPAHANLAALYLDLGERDLALGHLSQALKLAPDLAAAYVNRGVAWALVRDWTRAEQDWATALKLEPGQRTAALNLAAASEARGDAGAAQQWRARVPSLGAAPERAEMLGGVTPGAPLASVTAWLSEPGVREFDVPLGAGRPGFRLLVLERRGLALLTRDGVIEAVGAIGIGSPAATGAGIRPGDPTSRVVTAYGHAPGVEAMQSLSLWTYASRGLVVAVGGGRVQSAWTGRRGE